jgi:DNA-binding phage protein
MLKIKCEAFLKLIKSERGYTKFAKKLNISRSQLWRVLNAKGFPGEEFIAKFLYAYPDINFDDYFFTQDGA